ncbi:DUF2752 domain-containing protein [candidate division KSB1 bacterium]|nr:DUF2752 domain-containing protein [candidate division KSB1 bacterium]
MQKRTPDVSVGLIVAAIVIPGFCLFLFGESVIALAPPCLFHLWTGLPCPSCGATRAGIALAQLRMADAFFENPLFFALYMACILWGMNSLLAVVVGKNVQIILTAQEKKRVQRLLVSAIIINWLYLIAKVAL